MPTNSSAAVTQIAPPGVGALALPERTLAELQQLAESLDAAKLWWVSGYFAGLAQASASMQSTSQLAKLPTSVPVAAADSRLVTVVYGSQTGNAKRIAENLATGLSAEHLPMRLLSAADYPHRELANERFLVVVISTHGDGDPPDDARSFLDFIGSRRAPALPQLSYAILALGDSSYPQFCAVGKQLGARLHALGAKPWTPVQEADVDIAKVAEPWHKQVLRLAAENLQRPTLSLVASASKEPSQAAVQASYSRTQPYLAELISNQKITARGSDRDIRHLELALADHESLHYQPGDALGIWAPNTAAQVEQVLARTQLSGAAAVVLNDRTTTLRQALLEDRELGKLPRGFLELHAARLNSSPSAFVGASDFPQLLDLLDHAPAAWEAQALIDALRPMQPRLYSIASSMREVGHEAHLCVAHVSYEEQGKTRVGLASNFLREQVAGSQLRVFVERNARFRLPVDGSTDVIMIGAGTGVAPYRGFLQERIATGAKGRNWLIFGAPHARHDFLYQLEWQKALQAGQLHQIDLAFSRDQASKVYVQDRLREQGRAVFDWLENGAHVYVCGDASRMAKAVEADLLEIIEKHLGRSPNDSPTELALAYLDQLRQQKRYAKDVY